MWFFSMLKEILKVYSKFYWFVFVSATALNIVVCGYIWYNYGWWQAAIASIVLAPLGLYVNKIGFRDLGRADFSKMK